MTDHFAQKFRNPRRFLTDEVVRSTIETGWLRDNKDGCGCFVKPWGEGVTYYLIVGYHQDGYPIAVTAWPFLRDREAALNSGEWSSEAIDRIEELNAEFRRKNDAENRDGAYRWRPDR